MAKKDTRTIRYPLRIYDEQLLDWIDELVGTGLFRSKNDVINRAIEMGIPLLYKELFGKKIAADGVLTGNKKELDAALAHSLENIDLRIDDVLVVVNIIEYLVITIYNVELAKLSKVNISDDDVRSGIMSELPTTLQRVKDEIVAKQRGRSKKNAKGDF